jgi:hypothetical protein
VAAGGRDGARAEELLRKAREAGSRAIAEACKSAVWRMLRDPNLARQQRSLFNPDEKARFIQAIADTGATANLLGRARVRERVAGEFSEAGAWASFAGEELKPMPPQTAVEYFRSKVPTVGDGKAFTIEQNRRAFTVAGITEQSLLAKIQRIIADALEGGETTQATAARVQAVLDQAGVGQNNSGYAEMVVRTNMMSALNEGQVQEMQSPDLREVFPVWRYDGIDDHRAGDDHRPMFGRYYPNAVPFDKVRGRRVFNCRCVPTPIDAETWKELKAGGAKVAPGYEQFMPKPKPKPRKKPGTPSSVVAPPPVVPPEEVPATTVPETQATPPVPVPSRPLAPAGKVGNLSRPPAAVLDDGTPLPRRPETVEQALDWVAQNRGPGGSSVVTPEQLGQAMGVSTEEAQELISRAAASNGRVGADIQYDRTKRDLVPQSAFLNDAPRPAPTVATPEEVQEIKAKVLEQVAQAPPGGQKGVPIYQIRAAVPAPDRQAFDDAVVELVKEGKLGSTAITDQFQNRAELEGGIQATGDVTGWVRPKQAAAPAPKPTPTPVATAPVAPAIAAPQLTPSAALELDKAGTQEVARQLGIPANRPLHKVQADIAAAIKKGAKVAAPGVPTPLPPAPDRDPEPTPADAPLPGSAPDPMAQRILDLRRVQRDRGEVEPRELDKLKAGLAQLPPERLQQIAAQAGVDTEDVHPDDLAMHVVGEGFGVDAGHAPGVNGTVRKQPNRRLPDAARPPLTQAEQDAVQAYAGSNEIYQPLNDALRKGKPLEGKAKQVHEKLQSAMAKAPPLPEPVEVYRGLKGGPQTEEFIKSLEAAPDGVVTVPGYTSTTTKTAVAERWGGGGGEGNVSVKIVATRGLDTMPYSRDPSERELLLPADAKFRVVSVKKVGGGYQVEMEQLP